MFPGPVARLRLFQIDPPSCGEADFGTDRNGVRANWRQFFEVLLEHLGSTHQ
jgi:hypothetical protein